MDGSQGGSGKEQAKRRLGLLPEILPDPQKREGTGSARQRTLKTMERLVAVSAASALIASAEVVGGCGYGVVDPIPDPAICEGVAGSITAKATWKQGTSGLIVVLELGKPGRTDASYDGASMPTVTLGTILNSTTAMGGITLEIQPDGQNGYLEVYMPVTCSSGEGRVVVFVSLEAVARADGVVIPVSLRDE